MKFIYLLTFALVSSNIIFVRSSRADMSFDVVQKYSMADTVKYQKSCKAKIKELLLQTSNAKGEISASDISAIAGLVAENSQPPTISTIEQKIEPGCGCGFRLSDKSRRSQGLIFSSAAGEPTAIMNIDGRDVRLQENSKLNSYSGDSISVILNLKPAKKEYETNNYVGKMKVKRSGKVTTLKVIGACGC
jgi:hypothetical protein